MSTTLTVRIDEDVKAAAEKVLKDVGLNWTTFVNMNAKKIVHEQGVSLELKASEPRRRKLPRAKGAKVYRIYRNADGHLEVPAEYDSPFKDAWEL